MDLRKLLPSIHVDEYALVGFQVESDMKKSQGVKGNVLKAQKSFSDP